jgi:amino acid transporter
MKALRDVCHVFYATFRLIFLVPVVLFIACVGGALIMGLVQLWRSGGQPPAVVAPPPLSQPTEAISLWLGLRAFASGCTAMTGIEAVSNGVPLFRKPVVPNAIRTLTAIVVVLGIFLIGISVLCPAYHIHAMDQQQPGYQTIFSQLIAAVAGRGVFYHIAIASRRGLPARRCRHWKSSALRSGSFMSRC